LGQREDTSKSKNSEGQPHFTKIKKRRKRKKKQNSSNYNSLYYSISNNLKVDSFNPKGNMRPSQRTIEEWGNPESRHPRPTDMRGLGTFTPNYSSNTLANQQSNLRKRRRKKQRPGCLAEYQGSRHNRRNRGKEKSRPSRRDKKYTPRINLSKDTEDITSFFEGSSKPKYFENLPNLEPGSQNLLMDKNFISKSKKQTRQERHLPSDTYQEESEYNELGQRRTRHGMNLYQEESSEEYTEGNMEGDSEDEYEEEMRKLRLSEDESEESQLVDQSDLAINELPEPENHSESRNSDDKEFITSDLKEILDEMEINSLEDPQKLLHQHTSFEKMKNSNFKNFKLKNDLKIMSMNPIVKEEVRGRRGSSQKVVRKESHRMPRKESYRKHGLYYSNEKPAESRIMVKSYNKLEGFEENWEGYDEMTDSKILYADDMNPNLQSKVSKILDHLPGNNMGPNVVQNQTRKYMNILLVGKAFRGKSDLLKQIFQDAFGRRIELQAEKVKKGNFELISHEKKTMEYINNFTFTDSRGFLSGLAVEKWFLNIKKYLNQSMSEYYELQCVLEKDPSLKFKGIADNRMHLCLYLLQFPRLSPNDYIYLKKLQSYVNVLPVVVVKAEDQHEYSLSQIERMKQDIHQELVDLNMDCLHWDKQDGVINSLQKKLIGRTFPAVIQLRDLKQNVHRNRNLNSDFHIVIKMLTNPYISLFQWRTEQFYTSRLPKILKNKVMKKDKKDPTDSDDEVNDEGEKFGFGAGVAVGLGIIGAFMAFKNKLF
jgi:hypothetical protein